MVVEKGKKIAGERRDFRVYKQSVQAFLSVF